MRFEDERYVRLYTRDTLTCRRMGWQGRAVWHELLRKFDRAGILAINDEDPVIAISALTEIPESVVRIGLGRLLNMGVVVICEAPERVIFSPKFMPAQEAFQSNSLKQRNKRERSKARARYALLSDTTGVATDTTGVEDDESDSGPDDELDSGPDDAAKRHAPFQSVSDTTGVASDTKVSGATLFDTLKPSLAKPSLAKLSDPSLKSKSDLDRRSDQQALRAGARESGLAQAQAPEQSGREAGGTEQLGLPAGLDRPKHPDEDFTDDTLPVAAGAYVPSPWLQAEALASGFDRAALHRTLERYRERSNLPADATQSRHDKAFKGWLKNRKFDERPSTPPSRSNGGEKIPRALLPPELRPPVHPLDAERFALKPPWHPDFQKKQEAK